VITDTLPPDVYSPAATAGKLTWNIGALAGHSGPKTIEYQARPSLLTLPDTTLDNRAELTFTNAGGCVYAPTQASARTTITKVAPTKNPMLATMWLIRQDLRTPEILARAQATDTRFDGPPPDGVLTLHESSAVLFPPATQPRGVRAELLATLFNLAGHRINANTKIGTVTTTLLHLSTVGDAVRYAQATLARPPSELVRYARTSLVLTEINSGVAERY